MFRRTSSLGIQADTDLRCRLEITAFDLSSLQRRAGRKGKKYPKNPACRVVLSVEVTNEDGSQRRSLKPG